MSSFKWTTNFASALILIAFVRPELSFAQTQTSFPQLDQRVSHEPFSAASLSEDHGPLVYIWQTIREQLVVDDEAVSACLRDGVPDCAPAAKLLQIIGEAKAYRGKALIAHINRSINLLIRPAPGAWIGPLEVLTFADGDCKDYSIAKFFALREAGISLDRLRLVIVRNRRLSEDHMIVAAHEENAWLILDNATMVLATDSEDAIVYSPLFLLDESGVRRY
jgi:predicted transglutaminase-like cysteine proteinase